MLRPDIKTVLVTVKTYPNPAFSGVEVSCTAGITSEGEWIRLFPIPFRYLPPTQRFRKYQWIRVPVQRSSDARPESYRVVDLGRIELLGEPLSSQRNWAERKAHVLPLAAHCLCCLKQAWRADKRKAATLGVFRPRTIKRLLIDAAPATWTPKQLAALRQYDHALFEDPRKPEHELEKVPFTFRYEFSCDHDSCRGHKLGCTDWEALEAWRAWRRYGDQWVDRFRQKFEREMIEKKDTHFFVGTVHGHPAEWMIVGLFYPPRVPTSPQLGLF